MPTYHNLPRMQGVCPLCGADVSRAGGQFWGHLRECAGASWVFSVRDMASQCTGLSSASSSSSSVSTSSSESCVGRVVCAARARAARGARVLAAVFSPPGAQKATQTRERCRLRRAEILAGMARRAAATDSILGSEDDDESTSTNSNNNNNNGSDNSGAPQPQPEILEYFERAKDFKASSEVPGFCLELLQRAALPEDKVVSEPLTLPLPEDPTTWLTALGDSQKGVVFL